MVSGSRQYGVHDNVARTDRQQSLENYKQIFSRTTKCGNELLKFLERSHCGIWRCEQDDNDSRRWWLHITLPEKTGEMFDVHHEVLVAYVEYEQVEPRLLNFISSKISASLSVDDSLFILASFDPSAEKLLRAKRTAMNGVSLHLNSLSTDQVDLRSRIAGVLTSVDHFDVTSPIHDPAGFFGRKSEMRELNFALDRKQSIGIFGLRKTGKTSLLNVVAYDRRANGRPVVQIDVSQVSDADGFRTLLLESAWSSLSNDVSWQPPRLRTLNKNGQLKVGVEQLRLHWLTDLKVLSNSIGSPLELFIDEIDQFTPGRSHLKDNAYEMMVVLTQLRGLIQSTSISGGLTLVCAGVDPSLFERPIHFNGSDNLVYKLVRLVYLAPLPREEMATMVRSLGQRMGIRIRDHKVIDFLFLEYGGHALLSRKACSLAAEGRVPEQIPWHMTLESVEAAAKRPGDGTPLQQAKELLVSFAEWFPDEAEILELFWSSDPTDRELAEEIIRNDKFQLSHAVEYGLVTATEQSIETRITAIKRALNVS